MGGRHVRLLSRGELLWRAAIGEFAISITTIIVLFILFNNSWDPSLRNIYTDSKLASCLIMHLGLSPSRRILCDLDGLQYLLIYYMASIRALQQKASML